MKLLKYRSFALLIAGATAFGMTTSCSAVDSITGGDATIGKSSDLNPHDVEDLKDGGNLRLALTALPENFNVLQVDGGTAETATMVRAALPQSFTIDASGTPSVNTDYFSSIELTGTDPQVVTYTINPKAVWSDGAPITWEDIAAQAHALSGKDPAFLISSTGGFERVDKVERGVDDKQAVMTFAKPFSEWRGQFSGNGVLYPKAVTATPEAFNTSLKTGMPVSSGPFQISAVDNDAKRVTLTRSPYWWGSKPKLETITYSVLDDAARIPAIQNHELDATGITSLDEKQTVATTAGVALRQAPGLSFFHLTFNGAEGSILADPKLRTAIAKGIDRQQIVDTSQHGLVAKPTVLNNHVFLVGQRGSQDNSASVAFDPKQAASELDALGWKKDGEFRSKDGHPLEVRLIYYEAATNTNIAKVTQHSLAQIGVKLNLDVKQGKGFFSDFVTPGDFDLALFGWAGDPFPLGSLNQIYGFDPAGQNPDLGPSNYGKIGSAELNDLIDRTLSELDSDKAEALANDADKLVFEEVHSLPLFQSHGTVAVNDQLANFGARGLASLDWTKVAFLK